MQNATAPWSAYKDRVESFLKGLNLTDEQKNVLRRELAKLVLKIQAGSGATTLTKLSYQWNFYDDFWYFKNQYLDVSRYIHGVLWKNIVRHLNNERQVGTQAELSDVKYCIDCLTKEDIIKAKALKLDNYVDLDHIDLSTFKTGIKNKKEITAYVRTKSPALRFICDHDPSVSSEDFDQDLLCEFIRVWNIYPRSKGTNIGLTKGDDVVTMVSKYAETALNNKVNNLKEHYTCESRRRVAAVDDAKYKMREKLKKKMRDYAKTKNTGKPERKMFGKMTPFEKLLLESDPYYQSLHAELCAIDKEIRQSSSDFTPLVVSLVKGEDGDAKDMDVIDGSQDFTFVYDEAAEDAGIIKRELVATLKRCLDKFCGTELTIDHVGIKVQLNIGGKSVIGEVIDGDENYAIIECCIDGTCQYLDTRDDATLTSIDVSASTHRMKKFIELLLGDHDHDFENWALINKINLDNYDNLLRGARKYLGISREDMEFSKKAFASLRA